MAEFRLRAAAKSDAPAIAGLFLISSDGLATYIWSKIAAPGESAEQVGARRYAREGVAFSYENCVMAERGGKIAGMLHFFPMEDDPNAEPESDPVLRPYAELEDYGSLYVSGVAVKEEFRGHGLGTRLMKEAETQAKKLHLPRVSLICFEANVGAYKLYKRLGYGEIMRRALVPTPHLHYQSGDAVLMAKDV